MREPMLEDVNIPETVLGWGKQGQTHVCLTLQTQMSGSSCLLLDSFTPFKPQGSFVLKVFPDQIGLKHLFYPVLFS